MIPGSLSHVFKYTQDSEKTGHLHFHRRYNVVLSTRITLCTIAVDTKSFPAPVSNVSCSVNIPLDLCYANQDLH
jgi:hypothetical protein